MTTCLSCCGPNSCMSQYQSKIKRTTQRQTRDMNDSQERQSLKLVQGNKFQRNAGKDNGFIRTSLPGQNAPELRIENQAFVTNPVISKMGPCKSILGTSLRHGASEDSHPKLNADSISILSFPSSSLLHPPEAHQFSALEDSDAACHCEGVWHGPVRAGAGDGCVGRPRAPSLAPISAAPMPPPPADDPFHGDWPHW